MKKIILALLMGFCFLGAFGQVDPVVRSLRFEAQSEAEMNAIPANKLQEGSVCYREDTDSLWRYNGTTWAEMTGSGLANIVEDTTPQLGGDLDVQTNAITGVDNLTFDDSFANGHTMGVQIKNTQDFFFTPNGTSPPIFGYDFLAQNWQINSSPIVTQSNASSLGIGGISNLVEDTTPQLGGTLDLNTNSIQGDIYPSADNTYDLGLPASSFSNAYIFNSFIRHPSTAATDDYDWRFRTSPTTNNFEIGVEDAEGTGAYTTTYTLNGTGTPSAATDLIDKAYADANYGGGGSSLPVDDTTSLVQDPVDGTKEMRIDVGAVSTATTRTLTMPDADVNLGAFDAANIANGSVTNTAFQYIANLAQDAQEQIDSKFNNTGGTITGNINFGNSFKAINLADPINPQDAVTLNHLNNTFGANNLKSEPASRTNEETYSNVIGQPYADSQSDGAAPSGTLVLEFDVPPAFLSTGTTLNMDDYRGYNSSISASTAYTLDVAEVGGFAYAFVNAASEPTFTGTGITVINPVDSLAFIPNDNMLAIVWMLTSTTAMQWWIDIP